MVEMGLMRCECGVAAAAGEIDDVVVGVTEPAKSEESATPHVETRKSYANIFFADSWIMPMLASKWTCRRQKVMPDCHNPRCQVSASLATGHLRTNAHESSSVPCLAHTAGALHPSIELSIRNDQ
jgi:hypothetical protein